MSSITRPAMMFYFLPALALIAFVSVRRSRRWASAPWNVSVAAATWLLAIAPITLRNWVVSRQFVLIDDVSSRLFDLVANMSPLLRSGVEISPSIEPIGTWTTARVTFFVSEVSLSV
jgi:hypothetical protein